MDKSILSVNHTLLPGHSSDCHRFGLSQSIPGRHVVNYEVWEGSQHKAHVPYKEVR
jgi:hypothetical protein